MTIVLELLLQFAGELVLQIVAELGLHAMAEPFQPAPDRWFAAAGYVVFGIVAGFIGIAIFPEAFVRSRVGRIAMIVVVPIVAATATTVAAGRGRGFGPPYRPSLFGNAYLLALSMSLVRFLAASWLGRP